MSADSATQEANALSVLNKSSFTAAGFLIVGTLHLVVELPIELMLWARAGAADGTARHWLNGPRYIS